MVTRMKVDRSTSIKIEHSDGKTTFYPRPVGIKGTREQERRNHGPPRRILRSPRDRSGMKRRNEKVEHDFAYTIIDQG